MRNRPARSTALVGLAALWLVAASPASSTTLTVEPGPFPTILAALNAAQSGDTIVLPAGLYQERFSVLDFSGDLLIQGAGAGSTIIEPGPSADPAVLPATGGAVFIVSNSDRITIEGITFRAGNNTIENGNFVSGRGGGGTLVDSRVHLRDCAFENNMSFVGGALVSDNSGESTIENCSFTNNFGQRDGGAILLANDGIGAIIGSTFTSNSLRELGFNFIHDGSPGATHALPGFRLNGTPFAAGAAALAGEFFGLGDLPLDGFLLSFATVVGPVYDGFYAGPSGGAIFVGDGSFPFLFDNVFDSNTTYFGGGGIAVHIGSAATVIGNDFVGNTASRGGAIYFETTPTISTIVDNVISMNNAVGELDFPGSGVGAGMALYAASMPIIRNNELTSNVAQYGGGGISVYEESIATIEGNTFTGNSVTNNVEPPPLTLVDMTVVPTFPPGRGGAIEVTDGEADIEGNTFIDNQGRLAGGIFTSRKARIVGNIFEGNVAIAGVLPITVADATGSAIFLQNQCLDVNGNTSFDLFACVNNTGVFEVTGNTFLQGLGDQNLPHEVLLAGVNLLEAVVLQPGLDLFVESFDNYYEVETRFDESFYLSAYPTVASRVSMGEFESGFEHYVVEGQGMGFIPMTGFSEKFYLISNPDVAAAIGPGLPSGFFHFVNFGEAQMRPLFPAIQAEFDESFYLATYTDVPAMLGSPPASLESAFDHYYTLGQGELRMPRADFSEKFYLITNPDIPAAIPGTVSSGFDHFVRFPGRAIFPRTFDDCATFMDVPPCEFDESFYLVQNPSVPALIGFGLGLFESGYDHYYHVGQQPNALGTNLNFADPNSGFQEQCYRDSVSGLQAAIDGETFMSGWDHYLQFGRGEGRNPTPCP